MQHTTYVYNTVTEWDLAGHKTTNAYYDLAWLTQVDAVGVTSTKYAAYDGFGQVTYSQHGIKNIYYAFNYTFNLAGALTDESYPSGRVVHFGRDGVNRLSQVIGTQTGQPGKTYVASVQYASHGDWASYSYGNGLKRTYSFNPRLQPQQVTDTQTGQTKPLLDLQPHWGDANGQITNNNGSLRSLLINTNNGPNLADGQ